MAARRRRTNGGGAGAPPADPARATTEDEAPTPTPDRDGAGGPAAGAATTVPETTVREGPVDVGDGDSPTVRERPGAGRPPADGARPAGRGPWPWLFAGALVAIVVLAVLLATRAREAQQVTAAPTPTAMAQPTQEATQAPSKEPTAPAAVTSAPTAVTDPQRFRDQTGPGATKSWTLRVSEDEVGIVGGWQINNGPVGGTYWALPPGTHPVTIVDGFVEIVQSDFGQKRFCQLVDWAVQNSAGHKYVYPLPGWPAC